MNTDGAAPKRLTFSAAGDSAADWQPATPADLLLDLIDDVQALDLNPGLTNSLVKKLEQALA